MFVPSSQDVVLLIVSDTNVFPSFSSTWIYFVSNRELPSVHVEEEINSLLREKMVEAFNKIYDLAESRKLDMRLASYVVGIKRTAEATRFRGWA